MWAAIRSILSRIAAAAFWIAPAPAIIVRLANPPTLYGVPRESPRWIAMSPGSRPSSDAATWANVVSVPWPKLDTPVYSAARPARSIRMVTLS